MKTGLIHFDIQTQFLASRQLPEILLSRFQSSILFLYMLIQYPNNLSSSFLQKIDRPKLPKHLFVYDASEFGLTSSTTIGCFFSSRFEKKTSGLDAVRGNWIGWELQNLLMHDIFLEVPIHLSTKQPTEILPSRSQWTISSVYNVTYPEI